MLQKAKRATYRLSKSLLNGAKRRHFLYAIYPPVGYPFFPSDEALRTMASSLPRIRFVACTRTDHDVLFVRGVEDNIFRSEVDSMSRALRSNFLRTLGESASAERQTIRPNVAEAAERFLKACGFVNTNWDGTSLVSYDKDNHRYEGRLAQGSQRLPTQRFMRVCRGEPPFFFGAALF